MLIGLNNNEIVKHNQNTGYEIDAFPGDEKVSAGTHDKFRVNNDDKMKSNSANVIEEEKLDAIVEEKAVIVDDGTNSEKVE